MKKIITAVTLLLLFGSISFAEEANEKIRETKRDIQLLNLINGLYLSEEQMRALVPLIRQAAMLTESYRETLKKVFLPEGEELLSSLKEELWTTETGTASKETTKKVGKHQHEVKSFHQALLEDLLLLEEKAKGFLTENQLLIIEEYSPCLIPQKSLSNPVRVGQASSSSRFEKLLTRLYKAPDRIYEKRKEKILDRLIEHYEVHIGVLDDEGEALRREYSELFEEARALAELDFEIKKKELSERMAQKGEKQKRRRRRYELGKMGRLLLDERLIPILEARLGG